jgi:hypothetical protein
MYSSLDRYCAREAWQEVAGAVVCSCVVGRKEGDAL